MQKDYDIHAHHREHSHASAKAQENTKHVPRAYALLWQTRVVLILALSIANCLSTGSAGMMDVFSASAVCDSIRAQTVKIQLLRVIGTT